jgi:RNA polymerase sigma-70 factor (ECF subfamily)
VGQTEFKLSYREKNRMRSSDQQSTSLTLLSNARRREEVAWSELVRIYAPLVIHWCRQYDMQSVDVDDIVQNVFIAVSKHLDRFGQTSQPHSFRAWLWTITRSKILDHLRKQQASPVALTDSQLAIMGQLGDSASSDRSSIDAKRDLLILIHQGMEQIRRDFSEKTWTAFWRVTALGESPSNVAQDLGLTVAAVCMCRSRVLRRLRETIDTQ